MRTFKTVRTHDVSGVSGTGVVAEGVQLTGGKVVLHWLTDKSSVTIFDSIQDLIDIHGHEGSTTVQWDDTNYYYAQETMKSGGQIDHTKPHPADKFRS